MTFKLPLVSIIKETFMFIAEHPKQILQSIAVPTCLLAVIMLILSSVENFFLFLLLLLVSLLPFSKLSIAIHRLVLVEHKPSSSFAISFKEVRFACYLVCIYLLTKFSVSVAITGLNLMELNVDLSTIKLLLTLVSGYLLARLCLIFPALAVDKQANLKWAWNVSCGNGFRLFVIITLVPLLMLLIVENLLSFVMRISTAETLGHLQQLLLYTAGLSFLLFEIILLSFSYKAFENYYLKQRTTQQQN